jgi:hypothetical protein
VGYYSARRNEATRYNVHGVVDGRLSSGEQRMTSEQLPKGLGIDPPPIECRIETPPAAAVRRLEAQVDGRRYDACGE